MSSALDNFHKESCCLREVVHMWHMLLEVDVLLPYKNAKIIIIIIIIIMYHTSTYGGAY